MFQMHYTPNGKAVRDRSYVGLRFAKEPIHKRVRYKIIGDYKFKIPPGASAWPVAAQKELECDATGIGLFSHMHLRGKDSTFFAHYPDGKTETLLVLPNYSFDWQLSYVWDRGAQHFPKGTKIECSSHFDNSPFNPYNPNPSVTVTNGPQSGRGTWYDYNQITSTTTIYSYPTFTATYAGYTTNAANSTTYYDYILDTGNYQIANLSGSVLVRGDATTFSVDGENLVRQDLEHPAAEAGVVVIAVKSAERAQRGVLNRVVDIAGVENEPPTIHLELALNGAQQSEKSLRGRCWVFAHVSNYFKVKPCQFYCGKMRPEPPPLCFSSSKVKASGRDCALGLERGQ